MRSSQSWTTTTLSRDPWLKCNAERRLLFLHTWAIVHAWSFYLEATFLCVTWPTWFPKTTSFKILSIWKLYWSPYRSKTISHTIDDCVNRSQKSSERLEREVWKTDQHGSPPNFNVYHISTAESSFSDMTYNSGFWLPMASSHSSASLFSDAYTMTLFRNAENRSKHRTSPFLVWDFGNLMR